MNASRIVTTLAFWLLSAPGESPAPPADSIGFGVMGDSYSDEYQFYAPDRTTARNWVEILAAKRGVNFGRFSTMSRGEPRNQGYAYNWARSDATTDDLIRTGQHTGLAAQVARGDVKMIYVCIGGNDFINAMKSADPLKALHDMRPRATANYRLAVRTVLNAHPDCRVILATLPDIRNLPEFAGPIESEQIKPRVADAFTAAMHEFNERIRELAASSPRIALVDFDLTARVMTLVSRDTLYLGSIVLDRRHPANALDHFFLADSRHPGTLGQGLMAHLIVETLNKRFDMGIPPLTNAEVLAFARSVPATPSRLKRRDRPELVVAEDLESDDPGMSHADDWESDRP